NPITNTPISSYSIGYCMSNKALFICCVLLAVVFSACKKEGDQFVDEASTNLLNVINATNDTVNFYQNGTRMNNLSNLVPSRQLGYLSVNVGTQNFQFKKAFSPDVLVGAPFTIDQTPTYTLFVAGTSADKLFLLKDSLVSDTLARV